MPQILKLQDASDKFREAIKSVCETKEECIIQDEQGRPVAVVMPFEWYASYQVYLRQREADFAIFDEVDEDLKDYSPEELEARINQAVEEVKAIHNAKHAASRPPSKAGPTASSPVTGI